MAYRYALALILSIATAVALAQEFIINPYGTFGAGAAPLTFSDDFEGLTAGTKLADDANWENIINQADVVDVGGDIRIDGFSGSSDNVVRYVGQTFSQDQQAAVTIDVIGAAAGVVVRAQETDTFYLANLRTDGNVYLGQFISGSYTQIANTDIGTGANGDKIRLSVTGGSGSVQLTVEVDQGGGFSVVSGMNAVSPVTDITGGQPGVLMYQGSADLDDFTCTEI